MFERYTEQARRVIFFARYEASQFGSEGIEAHHFLLGLFRKDHALRRRFLSDTPSETIRKEIEAEITRHKKIPTYIDLPLSDDLKRSLEFAAQEAGRMGHVYIGTEHLLLGLLHEPTLASRILERHGLTLECARKEIETKGISPEPRVLTEAEARAEREKLHAQIESLPDEVLRRASEMLERMRAHAGGVLGVAAAFRGPVRGDPSGAIQEGNISHSRMEDGTLIFETERFHKGHRIWLMEKLRISEDGKVLHYTHELRGPKGEHHWKTDFDLT
ncbi:MAG: Clp protease N-terminal domain-containing protein [Deltaproteobacteria bacterium]